MNGSVVLGVDPSLAATGAVAIDVESGKVLHGELFKTVPTHKKLKIRVGDDNVARIQQIGAGLLRIHEEFGVVGWVVELPHGGSQNSKSATALGLVAGLVVGLSQAKGLPVEWVSPGDVKKVGGSAKASKLDVLEGTKVKLDWGDILEGRSKEAREAIGDAAGAVVAAWHGVMIAWMRNQTWNEVKI